ARLRRFGPLPPDRLGVGASVHRKDGGFEVPGIPDRFVRQPLRLHGSGAWRRQTRTRGGRWMRRSVLLIAPLAMLAACSAATSGAHWREVGSLDNGMVPFVEVEAAFAKDGSVYREATKQLCTSRCTEVGFFLPGDPAPPSGPREDFDEAGGWNRYAPAAVYDAGRGDFIKWDCVRAGDADAPLSALCGEGVKKEFDSVLRMAFRDRWTRGC